MVVSGRGDCEGEELYRSLLCPQIYVAPPTSCVQTVTGYLYAFNHQRFTSGVLTKSNLCYGGYLQTPDYRYNRSLTCEPWVIVLHRRWEWYLPHGIYTKRETRWFVSKNSESLYLTSCICVSFFSVPSKYKSVGFFRGSGESMGRQVSTLTGCPNHVNWNIVPNEARVSLTGGSVFTGAL